MPTDVLIDSVGAAIAMLVLAGIHRSGGQPASDTHPPDGPGVGGTEAR
jgi:hypothetical protein